MKYQYTHTHIYMCNLCVCVCSCQISQDAHCTMTLDVCWPARSSVMLSFWSARSVPVLSHTSPPSSACSLLVGEVGAIIVHFSPQQCMLIIGQGGRCRYCTLLPPAVHAHYWSGTSVPLSYTSPPSSACSLFVMEVGAIVIHFPPSSACSLLVMEVGAIIVHFSPQ